MTWSIPISYETYPDIIDNILIDIEYSALLSLRLVNRDWHFAVDSFLSGSSLNVGNFSSTTVLARNRSYLPIPVFHARGDPFVQAVLMRRVKRLVISAAVPPQMGRAMQSLSRDCLVMLIHQHGGDQRATVAVDRIAITVPRWCDCGQGHPPVLIHDAREVLMLVGEGSPGQSAWDGGQPGNGRACRLVIDAVTPSVRVLRLLLGHGPSLDEMGFPAGDGLGGLHGRSQDLRVELVLTQPVEHFPGFPPDLCERWAVRLGLEKGQVSAVRRTAAALLS